MIVHKWPSDNVVNRMLVGSCPASMIYDVVVTGAKGNDTLCHSLLFAETVAFVLLKRTSALREPLFFLPVVGQVGLSCRLECTQEKLTLCLPCLSGMTLANLWTEYNKAYQYQYWRLGSLAVGIAMFHPITYFHPEANKGWLADLAPLSLA